MRALLAGLAALCLLSGCDGEPVAPTTEVVVADELCRAVYGTALAPPRWASCDCFRDAMMALPAGAERVAGARWVVTELGYPILAAADGAISGAKVDAFIAQVGLATAAELKGWYQGYAARIPPSDAVTKPLIQQSGAAIVKACVM